VRVRRPAAALGLVVRGAVVRVQGAAVPVVRRRLWRGPGALGLARARARGAAGPAADGGRVRRAVLAVARNGLDGHARMAPGSVRGALHLSEPAPRFIARDPAGTA